IKGLNDAGLSEPVQQMNVIGYNELFEHINGNSSLEKAVILVKQNSRRYAKRQFTWFRHQINGTSFGTPQALKKAFDQTYSDFLRVGRNKT
ncbi:MAG: tRNA dimethylallyltransferase, partial [Candidatus Zixiibacteriota bacterium]